MPLKTTVKKATAKAALDAVVDSLDNGTGGNPRVRIYSGTQPASPDTAINTGTNILLAEFDLGTGAAFGNAATGTGSDAGYAIALLQDTPHTDTSANASGTAAWFRAVNKSGAGVIDGSVGVGSGYDMIIDNASVKSGQTVKLNSWKVRFPYK